MRIQFILLGAFLLAPATGYTGGEPSLLKELGCGHCHTGVELPSWSGTLPRIESMGRRYQPEYLSKFLQAPTKVRPHLTNARMPTFPLKTEERAALVRELVSQESKPTPPGLRQVVGSIPFGDAAAIARGRTLALGEYACTACHTIEGKGQNLGPSLDGLGARLQADWVAQFLVDPALWAPSGRMPAALFTRTGDGRYAASKPGRDATRDLGDLVAYLFRDGHKLREAPESAAAAPTDASWVEALGCEGCHGEKGDVVAKGPAMELIGRRLKRNYLKGYLQKPVPVRPAGMQPGDWGRMPDFRLTAAEVEALTNSVKALGKAYALPAEAPRAVKLSEYKKTKAKRFVLEKLDCAGCHAVGKDGGRMAPDLLQASVRLEPDYLYSMLVDPQRAAPGVNMPKPRFRPTVKTRELVYQWLRAPGGATAAPATYLTPKASPPPAEKGEGGQLYRKHCAACHGPGGKGDGFNAAYLAPKPTDHTDATRMAKRPDDTLFDGIHVGGFVLNKSHRMPGFGATLTTAQLRALVGHIRSLCQCEQPKWAGDGR